MRKPLDRLPSPLTLLRLGLAVFVLAWLFGPYTLQSAVPIWLPFLIALGLELHFFVGAFRPAPAPRPNRGPQTADRERYGYGNDTEELLLVREGGDELWIPYSGETDEELQAVIAEARERPETEATPAVVADPERERLRPPLRRFGTGLGLIGALALIFWVVESRTGWNGLDASTRAEAAARFSEEASRVAAKPVTIRCDESGDYVGAVQHADGAGLCLRGLRHRRACPRSRGRPGPLGCVQHLGAAPRRDARACAGGVRLGSRLTKPGLERVPSILSLEVPASTASPLRVTRSRDPNIGDPSAASLRPSESVVPMVEANWWIIATGRGNRRPVQRPWRFHAQVISTARTRTARAGVSGPRSH